MSMCGRAFTALINYVLQLLACYSTWDFIPTRAIKTTAISITESGFGIIMNDSSPA